jgi:hypothetical protein
MVDVVDLLYRRIRREQLACFLEGHVVETLVPSGLLRVPFKTHLVV